MNTNTSQAQLFAAEYAKNTAQEMLDTISGVGNKAGRVSKIVLAVSMPHQIAFILGLAPLAWDSLEGILASITLILGSILIPIAVDYLILICIQIIAARGMAKAVKKGAIWVMTFPILLSMTVNVLAPAPPIMRTLFGAMVVLIPLAEGLRAFIRPDFGAIEAMENEVAAQVTQIDVVEVARQQAIADAAAQQKALEDAAEAQRLAALAAEAQRRSDIAARGAATRRERAEEKAAKLEAQRQTRRDRAAARRLADAIPTSPGKSAVILSAADQAKLAEMDFPTR